MVYAAVMGYGVVGSGTVEVFYKNYESLCKKCGMEVDIKYILDIRDFDDTPYAGKFTKNFEDIINDPQVKVVAEVMGGVDPAYDYTKRLLMAGKSVVTSNKELVATKGAELLEIARANNANYLFEASVGGGIPIIRPISQCLAANDIGTIIGILNGTTNFILTKMINDKMDFDSALKLAQDLGYAERNPSADVDGHDACRKICILASLAFGSHVYPYDIHTEGIGKITLEDVAYADDCGNVIKLLGVADKNENGKLTIFVAPALVAKSSQLSNVDDVFNAILVRGDAIGDTVFYGKGAGKLPTASAVVADIIDAFKHLDARKYLYWEDSKQDYVLPFEGISFKMYVCGKVTGDAARVKSALGAEKILSRPGAPEDELALISKPFALSEFNTVINEISADFSLASMIRVIDC